MITDLREVPDGTEIPVDVCVVGAGAAGITLARVLDSWRGKTIVLESGGLQADADTHALATGSTVGQSYFPLEACRLRYLGGSTNHWAGHCGQLDPLDFEARPWVPYSGWPLGKGSLDPWYRAAQMICGLGPQGYEAAAWLAPDRLPPALDPEKLALCLWQFSPPTRFGEVYRAELAAARRVEILLNATATRLETDPAGRSVRRVIVRGLDGKRAIIRARHVVLAGGGIENPRLLLASNHTLRDGLGNDHGLVGRFFMDHPHVRVGDVFAKDQRLLTQMFERFQRGSRAVRAGLHPTPHSQQRYAILNCGVNISATPDQGTGYDALRRLFGAEKSTLMLFSRSEPAPNPESRITLGPERDALGVPKPVLRWQLSELDIRTVRHTALLVAEELGRLNLGRLRLAEWLQPENPAWPDSMSGGCHHIGTTRMSAEPRAGVVDRDCRVHGFANLYVSGSSVFPTAGFMNPTLTIVALALRLGDHLQTQLRAGR